MAVHAPTQQDRVLVENSALSGHQLQSEQREAEPQHTTMGFSRRGAFTLLGAALAPVLAAPRKAHAQPVATAPADVDPSADWLLMKLVDRITFGANQEEQALARSLGYEGYLEYHLNHTAIVDTDADARMASYPIYGQTFAQLIATGATVVRQQLLEARLMRGLLSKRQLFERIVDMWTNHFAIYIFENDNVAYLKVADDTNVIRTHALGTFPNMLIASAHSPAMLHYLDNTASTATQPNENYARELMELHTLSVSGGYTQNDVIALSKILSGWSFESRSAQPTYGQFRYISSNHNTQPKTFLGVNFPGNQGQAEGDTALNMLINHASTARFVARKLCLEFLGENTPDAIVTDIANVYTQTNGDIKAMLRRVLRPERLAAAPRKLKRPMHLFISSLRTLPVTVNALNGLRAQLQPVQHQPFSWGAPDGYPDRAEYWQGNFLPRMNWGSTVASNAVAGVVVDLTSFYNGATASAQQVVDRINERCMLGRMLDIEKTELLQYIGTGTPSLTKRTDALAIALGGPTFQWY